MFNHVKVKIPSRKCTILVTISLRLIAAEDQVRAI